MDRNTVVARVRSPADGRPADQRHQQDQRRRLDGDHERPDGGYAQRSASAETTPNRTTNRRR